ncbi:MAG TPA: amidohydrolase family protein [Terracidiphilus sp.]|nr:amidohydrolase family protein [Terracidiphilus sp.]
MRSFFHRPTGVASWIFTAFVLGAFLIAPAQLAAQTAPQPAASSAGPVPLALTGGTVIDVTDWGRSARDLRDATVLISDGRIVNVGPSSSVQIPKNSQVIDCTGKYILPGLVDGFAGINSQGQASADLYMGVTTVVAVAGRKQGQIDFNANPRPNLYLSDSVGATDDWSLLAGQAEWSAKLREGQHPVELSPEDTARQMTATSRLGTRVVRLGAAITAANAQWIIARAHQMGLVTYGDFVATPYRVGIESGVDALPHMGHYELGVIPDELQQPLVQDPFGSAANTAFDYAQHLPPTDPHLLAYARFVALHHAALMPTFSTNFLRLPGHRNLWNEAASSLLNPANLYNPPDRATGELDYPLSIWTRHLPGITQRWMQDNLRKKADQAAMRLWKINQTIFSAGPHYLAASGAPVSGAMPGISMHTELEMLVRLGLSAREALAAATNNYALEFGWTELGQVAPGRRADILVVDGDPTANIWNVRRISTLILDGKVIDREALLHQTH